MNQNNVKHGSEKRLWLRLLDECEIADEKKVKKGRKMGEIDIPESENGATITTNGNTIYDLFFIVVFCKQIEKEDWRFV